ncbi:AI-2E family transporter [Vibrio sp. V27_P1S3P104]|uniref:AI-2E family transporter n=1 Tax=unclassified Vibrio TaxID=2614977 RepID=UPI0013735195|nr:AI-2E family transporter [Vibrio sp. V28_P6S34P95]NAX04226.1 AI-2E family transporter [Vibrio sp. V30_P3S12P165]NAX33054.1 AI-2E family transporter [Vibrio sp. V29_P1S30P107]NAX38850.1 AI-2E family transporter [Vibrio sp. V27_P1S3P104]NAX39187.1 AI-2E family transporter [Vibrio sp. V26_P1S5P106]
MPDKLKLNSNHWVLIAALLVAALSCYLLLKPYINAIIMAFIISLLMFPIHQKLETKLPTHKNIVALLSCIILVFIIVLPLLLVFTAMIQQGAKFSQNLYQWGTEGGIQTVLSYPWVKKGLALANDYLPFHEITPQQIAQKTAQLATTFASDLVSLSAKVLGDATSFLVNFFLMLFVLFFLLRDHDKIILAIRHIVPLSRSQEDRLLNEIEQVSKSAIMGSFLTAIAQGVAGGFGMWLAGFPGLFWGTMMGFASFIPVVGTALIWVPATLYLFIIGDMTWMVFLLIWSIAVVGSIDNLLRPFLMQGSAGMNTLMIFFSLLGGLQLFGFIGLIYGPLIFAITMVLFNLYEEEFHSFLNRQDNS